MTGFAALLAAGSLVGTAQAAEECSGFLPDFGCDREARPAGHVAPMSMPYLFEDPYITTELNLDGLLVRACAQPAQGHLRAAGDLDGRLSILIRSDQF